MTLSPVAVETGASALPASRPTCWLKDAAMRGQLLDAEAVETERASVQRTASRAGVLVLSSRAAPVQILAVKFEELNEGTSRFRQ